MWGIAHVTQQQNARLGRATAFSVRGSFVAAGGAAGVVDDVQDHMMPDISSYTLAGHVGCSVGRDCLSTMPTGPSVLLCSGHLSAQANMPVNVLPCKLSFAHSAWQAHLFCLGHKGAGRGVLCCVYMCEQISKEAWLCKRMLSCEGCGLVGSCKVGAQLPWSTAGRMVSRP